MNPPPAPRNEDDYRDDDDRQADRERERRANRTLKEKGADWLEKQGVSTVLLCVLILMCGWFAYYLVTAGIPGHITQIQAGYRELQTEYKAMQADLLVRMAEERKRDREWSSMERDRDRAEWSRTLNLHLEKEARKAAAKGSEGT